MAFRIFRGKQPAGTSLPFLVGLVSLLLTSKTFSPKVFEVPRVFSAQSAPTLCTRPATVGFTDMGQPHLQKTFAGSQNPAFSNQSTQKSEPTCANSAQSSPTLVVQGPSPSGLEQFSSTTYAYVQGLGINLQVPNQEPFQQARVPLGEHHNQIYPHKSAEPTRNLAQYREHHPLPAHHMAGSCAEKNEERQESLHVSNVSYSKIYSGISRYSPTRKISTKWMQTNAGRFQSFHYVRICRK